MDRSFRCEFPINHKNPRKNVFNIQELIGQEAPQLLSSENGIIDIGAQTTGKESHEIDHSEDTDEDEGELVPKKGGVPDEYDVDDDFIDDTDLFYDDSVTIPKNIFEEEMTKPSPRKKKSTGKGKREPSKHPENATASGREKESKGATVALQAKIEELQRNMPSLDCNFQQPGNLAQEGSTLGDNHTPGSLNDSKKRKKSPHKVEDSEKKRQKQDSKSMPSTTLVDTSTEASIASCPVDIGGYQMSAPSAGGIKNELGALSSTGNQSQKAQPIFIQSVVVSEIVDSGEGIYSEDKLESEKKKKRKRKDNEHVAQLSEFVVEKLTLLKAEAEKETFEVKRHFPPQLRPPLFNAAWAAACVNQFDLNFIKHLREFLPYNTFTLKKLTTKMLIREGSLILQKEMEKMYDEIEKKIKEACSAQEETFEQQLAAITTEPIDESQIPATNESGDGPKRKFKWSEELRTILWNLLAVECALAEFANVCHTVDISREYSSFKRKMDRKVLAGGQSTDAKDALSVSGPLIYFVGILENPSLPVVLNILKSIKVFFPMEQANQGTGTSTADGQAQGKRQGKKVTPAALPGTKVEEPQVIT
ncbi:hypothetical protein HDU96_005305 [Phlyctochytrium bullatum]|nr:hypothetical protein HDU96_005305 [Phlyctochytrium bullatum]